MQHIMQRFYPSGDKSVRSGDRKKLKRQSINSSTDMDMSDISANSLLCGMQQFDRAVQNMEETILVPSRLMDMSVSDESSEKPKSKPVPSLLRSSDAYDVFQLLKSVRCTVRRGCCEAEELEPKPLQRMPSMLSSQSLSSLSSEASSSGAAGDDSGHESAEDASASEDPCEAVRARFESHLSGLGQCLAQMTEAASFLSSRYEQQLDSAF